MKATKYILYFDKYKHPFVTSKSDIKQFEILSGKMYLIAEPIQVKIITKLHMLMTVEVASEILFTTPSENAMCFLFSKLEFTLNTDNIMIPITILDNVVLANKITPALWLLSIPLPTAMITNAGPGFIQNISILFAVLSSIISSFFNIEISLLPIGYPPIIDIIITSPIVLFNPIFLSGDKMYSIIFEIFVEYIKIHKNVKGKIEGITISPQTVRPNFTALADSFGEVKI